MLNKCVFKPDVNTVDWCKKAGKRAVKTMAQAALTLIGSDLVNIVSLDWKYIIGACATMGVVSLLTSIVGIPEVETNESK